MNSQTRHNKQIAISLICLSCLVFSLFGVYGASTKDGALNSLIKNYTLYTGSDNRSLSLSIEITSMQPYITEMEGVDLISASSLNQDQYNVQHANTTVAVDYIINYRFVNSSDDNVYINTAYCDIVPTYYPATDAELTYIGYSYDILSGNVFGGFSQNTQGQFRWRWSSSYSYNGRAVIPSHQNAEMCCKITAYYNFNTLQNTLFQAVKKGEIYISDIVVNHPVASECSKITNFTLTSVEYNTQEINEAVHEILEAYQNNSQQAQNLYDDADSTQQTIDNIHSQEQQYYQRNQNLLEFTGLGNFEFDADQQRGFDSFFNLFERFWQSLGAYNTVITFTLMMSFSAFFLRHRPIKATSNNNNRNTYKGSKQNE